MTSLQIADQEAATRRRYWPALDGLRAVAVGLVFVYHALPRWAPRGGQLGVTMFFTLSGFLITTLLLAETTRTGSISLRRFYLRRAHRLFPALFSCVAVTGGYVAVSGNFSATLDAVVPVVLYVFNWFRVSPGEGFGLLEHAWSLSIEEQFYLLWPLLVLGVAAVAPSSRRVPAVGALAVVGSVLSLLWRLRLWDDDDPGGSALRLYNGTDTVADQLLIGAALAAAVSMWGTSVPWRRIGAAFGPVALGFLVWVALFRPGGSSVDNNRLYLQWGGAAFSLAAALVVVAATEAERSWIARLLAARPLVAIGRVSYGVYLWHVPVIFVVDHHMPGLDGPLRIGVFLVVTGAIVTTSWQLLERPLLRRARRIAP